MIKPILFNTQMVQAILDGRKTTTRRIIKDSQCFQGQLEKRNISPNEFLKEGFCKNDSWDDKTKIEQNFRRPYNIGEILYVRETWCKLCKLDDFERIIEGTDKFYYRADGYNPTPFNCFPDENGFNGERDCPRWKPSIHMPKEAARIFLKVTDVRVERLQDISEVEALKEGAQSGMINGPCSARFDFQEIWDSTVNKKDIDKYGWNANPYVWAISFERIDKSEVESNEL